MNIQDPFDVSEVVRRSRHAHAGDSAAKERLRARLSTQLAPVPPAKNASLWFRVAVPTAMLFVGLFTAMIALRAEPTQARLIQKSVVVPVVPTRRVGVAEALPVASVVESVQSPRSPTLAQTRPRHARMRTSTPDDALLREQALLADGRAALSAANPLGALHAVRIHEARYATGFLVEEREALRVQAFGAMQDHVQQRAAAERFLRRFPTSIYREIAESALQR